MCRARSGKRKVRKTIARAQRELLRYHEATARFNAAIRNTFPRQHRIAKSMERHSSGLINDAPEEIQSFVGAAEDACYFCCPREASSGAWIDGVAETIDAARACVGCPRLGAYGDRVYPMAVTWVEKALASEMRAAAGAFFQSVYELPCADTKKLREEERAFVYKHERMMLDLRRAKFDPSPTYTLLLSLRKRLPGEVCSAVVRFLI